MVEEYRRKLLALLLDRPLSDEEESARCEELSDIWYKLSAEEQALIEVELSAAQEAPESLGLVDRIPADGISPMRVDNRS